MSLLAQNIFHIFQALVYTKDLGAKLYQMLLINLEKLLSFLRTDLRQMLYKCHELNYQSVYQSISNIYSDFKTQETKLQLQKVSKL